VAQVKVGDLSALDVGDVFTLDAKLGDPVELRLNGVAIAHGELVSMGEHFAVRIEKVAEHG
jgi:flagellar motor switch/type III secretory pathway protein FliN